MEEEIAKAIEFLNGNGYTCMDTHRSSHVGVSARKKMDYKIGTESAKSYADSSEYKKNINDKINAVGGKKRSYKKCSHNKRSHKQRSHKKRS